MSTQDMIALKKALEGGGVEIYRAEADTLHIAERIRLHLMDAGVRVRGANDGFVVGFTVRCQRSDFPHSAPETLFERVREAVGADTQARGYAEAGKLTVEVKDPVDDTRILDVWHEIAFEKATGSTDEVISEVRWALGVEKYVAR